MKKKEIDKALKSDKPITGMFSLIPKDKMDAFKKFAKRFGFTEDKINALLASEK